MGHHLQSLTKPNHYNSERSNVSYQTKQLQLWTPSPSFNIQIISFVSYATASYQTKTISIWSSSTVSYYTKHYNCERSTVSYQTKPLQLWNPLSLNNQIILMVSYATVSYWTKTISVRRSSTVSCQTKPQ